MNQNAQYKVLVCVTGCIAAYKACEVVRGLQKASCDVRVAMTKDACSFVGPLSFEALSGHPVLHDLETYPESPIAHVQLAQWADLILVCPCTGNVLAKADLGIADDALTSTLLAGWEKLLFAPAMNVHMWQNPATQAHVAALTKRGNQFILPVDGRLACGDVGEGKLADVDLIVARTMYELDKRNTEAVLATKKIVITAGPTHEAIDPVRYIANRSTGKMGYAIAYACSVAGAQVTLISGPTHLPKPCGCELISVTSAQEMYEATLEACKDTDAAICAAAVADYTPTVSADHKLKKETEHLDILKLQETPDILASISADKGKRVVIGFAAETEDLVHWGKKKLMSKDCDLIVANDVSRAESTFGSDTNTVTFIGHEDTETLECLPKSEVARHIVNRLAKLLESC